jgi:transcriptional regulator with XRE-family HTH domain
VFEEAISVMGPAEAEEQGEERIGALLRRCRERFRAERASLGPYLRLTKRIGKAVTQEEVAESVGISREWYTRMEGDRPVRVSARVLARIADALMMDPAERAALFRLAVPELRSTSLTDRTTATLDTFGSLRHLMRRLWAATSEAEALRLVREHGTTMLSPDAMVTFTRLGEGRWVRAATGDDDDDRGERFHALIRGRCCAAVIDDLHCYTLMAQPGELITAAERDARFPQIAAEVRRAQDAVRYPDATMAMAHVRSRRGLVARIQVLHHTGHPYSELERAQLGALANLTSLALRDAVSSPYDPGEMTLRCGS